MRLPKVSIIMPSLNVAPYIRECIESAINQTLKEIEIICVDAGSTDGTLEILQEYAEKDSRIQLIKSEKKSYGYQMNLGLDAASGEYIGILETDDWAEPNMFETLWNTAKEHCADMVKSNFFTYTTINGVQNVPVDNLKRCTYDRVFSPVDEHPIFAAAPSIWSGIYLREMLLKNHIRFNETPGASFQDTSFYFMVCTASERCYLLQDCFLHYRRDNDGSSVHSKGKIYYIADEMHHYGAFLDANPDKKERLRYLFQFLKFKTYQWNLTRLAPVDRYAFLKVMHREFADAFEAGVISKETFSNRAWGDVLQIANDPASYYRRTQITQEESRAIRPVLYKSADCAAPQISVILPFHNAASRLKECLDHVACQSFRDIEIICVDDGSMDDSRKIVEEYAAADSRFAILDMQVGKGTSAGWNAGMDISRGKYIYCLNMDSPILPDALEKLYTCAEKEQLDILYFGKTLDWKQENVESVSGETFLLDQLQKQRFCGGVSCQLIRRSLPDETQLRFREDFSCSEELFSIVLAAQAKRVCCIEDDFYARRDSSKSSTAEQPVPDKFVDQFVAAMAFGIAAVNDLSLGHAVKQALSRRSAELLEEARATYEQLSATPRKSVTEFLPAEYHFFFKELVLESWDQKKRFAALKRSESYKVGAAITLVPRKIRGFIRGAKKKGS